MVVLEKAAFCLLELVVWVWPLAERSSLTGVTGYRRLASPACITYLPSNMSNHPTKAIFIEAKEFKGVAHLGGS